MLSFGTAPILTKPVEAERLAGSTLVSPVGSLRLAASGRGLVAVLWPDDRPGRVPLGPLWPDPSPILREAEAQLAAYFVGRLRRFDLPLDARGTLFQQAVWTALQAISFGETRTYREVATAIGRPTASRAVGAANGRNPLSIVVPCHRVIGTAGGLTGFAGGLAIKQALLAHEGIGEASLF